LALDRLPKPDGQLLDSGRFGFADLLVTLFPGVDLPHERGSHEWGGGRFQTWRTTAGELCVQVRVAGDTDAQTDQLLGRLAGWASRVGIGATAEQVRDARLGRPVVELNRCTF
jgi:hypothetical protein